jgi:hypothetical protein
MARRERPRSSVGYDRRVSHEKSESERRRDYLLDQLLTPRGFERRASDVQVPAGVPLRDPTPNVLDLVNAAVRRIDDMAILRGQLSLEQIRRVEQAQLFAESMAVLRSEHNREIRHMESDRVDKIRSVDVANAAATAAQLLSAVTTLATTAQATAETLRNQVAATAAAVASQTERVVNPIIERLALLEKSSNFGQGRAELANPALSEAVIEMRKMSSGLYERAGKESVTDPAMAAAITALTQTVAGLTSAKATGEGKQQGLNLSAALVMGAITIVSGLLGIAGVLYAVLKP